MSEWQLENDYQTRAPSGAPRSLLCRHYLRAFKCLTSRGARNIRSPALRERDALYYPDDVRIQERLVLLVRYGVRRADKPGRELARSIEN